MLPVVIERAVQIRNAPEGRRDQRNPVVVHHRVLRHRMRDQEPHERVVHEHCAAGHIVLHEQLTELPSRRAHLLIAHIGGRYLPPCAIDHPHIAVHQERQRFPVARFEIAHRAGLNRQFVRMPDVILVGEQIVVALIGRGKEARIAQPL